MEVLETKNALMSQKPVICTLSMGEKIRCSYVSGIIYRRDQSGNKIVVSVELLDASNHSVMISTPEKVEYWEGQNP